MTRVLTPLSCALAALLCLQPDAGHAATDNAILSVGVEVTQSCSLGGTTLDFGSYTPAQTDSLLIEGSLTFDGCSSGEMSFALDGGQSGDTGNRRLRSGTGELGYQLYQDSNRSIVWGSGAEAKTVSLVLPGSGSVPLYAAIPGGQNAQSGTYADSVNITLTF